MVAPIWAIDGGDGPLVATAIHDGTTVRDEVRQHMLLPDEVRRREEDPFTAAWTRIAPVRIVGLHSRFEVDLNRPRETAVYRTPEDCWGLDVWDGHLPEDVAAISLEAYDDFYGMLQALYRKLGNTYGRFVVFDLHSYNHRRDGVNGPTANKVQNPQVNVGTGTMRHRSQWASIIDRFTQDLKRYDFHGGTLDVRENVKFQGGQHARWAHETFPDSACVLAIEVKKFFMDEWTGKADQELVKEIGKALASTVPGVLEELAWL
ncbi:MAG: N-formylglutamate amidohydrolase [Kiritimatiellae bacterium]|nr:N-formylglutamate amidohydrolase [Kiritimatiellia bacterium]